MNRKFVYYTQWLLPLALLVAGAALYRQVPTGFLGLSCFALAGLVCLYLLIALLARKEPMAAKVLRTVLTSLVCFGFTAVLLTGALVARDAAGQADEVCAYVVVLGAKVNGTQPSRILHQRIEAAREYLQANPDTVAVLSGGQGDDEGISEAQCMFHALTQAGIDPQRLWLEDASTSTQENLSLSLQLIQEKTGTRPERVGVISSEFHLHRAGRFARQCGVEAVGIPGKTENPVHFLNYFLREIAGVWHFMIFGG